MIAIGLYGEYAPWFQKNIFYTLDADLFFVSYDSNCTKQHEWKDYRLLDSHLADDIDNFGQMHILHQRNMVDDYFISILTSMIDDVYDEVHILPFERIYLNGKDKYVDIISDAYVAWQFNAYTLKTLPQEICEELLVRLGLYTLDTFRMEKCDTVMLVPSVIRTTTADVDGQLYRSVFTPEERFHQTLLQLQDIQALPEQPRAIVLEGSLPGFSQLDALSNYSLVVLTSLDTKGDLYANRHSNKSINEVYVIHRILPRVKSDWILKFGGRYRLLPTFNLSQFLQDAPVCKRLNVSQGYTEESIINTVLYSFPRKHLMKMFLSYQFMEYKLLENRVAVENVLGECFEKHFDKIHYVKTLHLYGKDGFYARPNYL